MLLTLQEGAGENMFHILNIDVRKKVFINNWGTAKKNSAVQKRLHPTLSLKKGKNSWDKIGDTP